jgi:hypothetical protein
MSCDARGVVVLEPQSRAAAQLARGLVQGARLEVRPFLGAAWPVAAVQELRELADVLVEADASGDELRHVEAIRHARRRGTLALALLAGVDVDEAGGQLLKLSPADVAEAAAFVDAWTERMAALRARLLGP